MDIGVGSNKHFRLISLDGNIIEVPSLQCGAWKYVIRFQGKFLSINVQGTDVSFNRIHARGRLISRQVTEQGEWVLHRIRPNRATRLRANFSFAVVEYDRRFAECAWFLLERHRKRGEAGYILFERRLET